MPAWAHCEEHHHGLWLQSPCRQPPRLPGCGQGLEEAAGVLCCLVLLWPWRWWEQLVLPHVLLPMLHFWVLVVSCAWEQQLAVFPFSSICPATFPQLLSLSCPLERVEFLSASNPAAASSQRSRILLSPSLYCAPPPGRHP